MRLREILEQVALERTVELLGGVVDSPLPVVATPSAAG
jgi:hypothetical protein